MNPVLLSVGENFRATQLGPYEEWANYHSHFFSNPNINIDGKFFLAELLGMTGTEISINSMPPKAKVPFWHRHQSNEETYIFLAGNGIIEIDDFQISINPGTVITIDPKGARTWENTGDVPLIYLVIQAGAGTLTTIGTEDGIRLHVRAN